MSAAMSNKAEASEMAQALSELGSNLEMIASNTFPKVELQQHLSSKIDKVCEAVLLVFMFGQQAF